jgi:O-antigen ligase
VLAVGAVVGFVIYMSDRRHRFGALHLLALTAVLAALISAMVSAYPYIASLKTLSLFLLFLYGSAGARLAILGREAKFFSALLLGCELLVYGSALAYFVFHHKLFGNPNSLGAIMGVVIVPLMIWGILSAHRATDRRRRSFALLLSIVLLLFSLARAGIVAAAVASLLLCIGLRQYRFLLKGLALTAVLAAGVAFLAPPPGQSDSVASTFLYKGKQEAGLWGSRQAAWQKTWDVIQERPWFGTGFGTSNSSPVDVPFGHYSSDSFYNREHGNSYLAITESVGLLGVTPFFVLLAVITGRLHRVLVWMRCRGDVLSPVVPIAVVIIAGLVHAAFEDWLFAVGYYICVFFWTFVFALDDVIPAEAQAEATRRPSMRTITKIVMSAEN